MSFWAVDVFAIAASCLALYFTLSLKKTYFLDSRFFLALANTGFILVLFQNMVSGIAKVPSSMLLFVLLNGLMAASVGFASFLLERNPGRTGVRELVAFTANPPRTFAVYMGIVVSWTVSSAVLQPFQLNQTVGDPSSYYYTYEAWWVAFSAVLVGSFLLGPVYSLYRRSLQVKDSTVVRSMRMLVVGWTGFGFVEFVQGTAGSYFLLAQDVGSIVDSFLFILISLALKEPTLLGRIMAETKTVNRAVYSSASDTVVLYNLDLDRRKLVEGFAKEQLHTGQEIVCFVPKADVPLYTAILLGTGFTGIIPGKGKVDVEPLELMLTGGEADLVYPGFSPSKRELVDLGELERSTSQRIIAKVRALDVLLGPTRTGRTWAVKVESPSSDLVDEIRGFSSTARIIDMAGHQSSFSKLLGIDHQKLLGSRLLLEYDPSCSFEDLVSKFTGEFQANAEPVAVFTSTGSPVHRRLEGHRDVRVFCSSTKTSTPLKVSEEEVLLPERDTSLLLDAVVKLLQTYQGRSVALALDIFTDLTISLGFDKAYGVLSSIAEMAEEESATLLILVNRLALEERVLNGIRGLFQFQARLDAEGLRPVRIPNREPRRLEDVGPALEGRNMTLART